MAYADRSMGGNRVVAGVVVIVLSLALGYAFVTGLAYQYIKKTVKKMDTFDVAPPPPPPPDVPPPPPPPQQQPMTPPPVVTPPPIVAVPQPPVIMQTTPTPPPVYIPTPTVAPPAPPAPPPAPPAPPKVSKAAGLKGNPGQFFGADNYPPAAKRAGAEGRVVATLTVGTDGRVSDCRVTTSSGNSDLDDTTCRIAKSRVRFTPAKDQNGNSIALTYPLAVTWRLED